MEIGADRPPSRHEEPTEQKEEFLQPSSRGVLKQAIQHYRENDREFADVYFPDVTARGYVTWGDVFGATDLQADALRPIMVESIRHFWKQDGKEKNRCVNLLTREPEDPNFVSYYARKAKYWTAALRDLCKVFGLESPL